MMRKVMVVILALIWLINSSGASAQADTNVEVFDIQQGKVIKTVPTDSNFQQTANNFINGIEGIYVKVSPIPPKGYLIRIPLSPSIHIKNQWMDDLINEIILVYGKNEKPFLMTFDEENNIHIFNFKGDTELLLKSLNIDLNNL